MYQFLTSVILELVLTLTPQLDPKLFSKPNLHNVRLRVILKYRFQNNSLKKSYNHFPFMVWLFGKILVWKKNVNFAKEIYFAS